MARSTASSEPLTSPTPSPNHSPIPSQRPVINAPVRASAFGSDSELSELSDDEEGNQPHNKQENEVLLNGVAKTRSKAKRVLPGAMWDWAYKKKPSVLDADPDGAVDDQEQEEGEIEQEPSTEDNVPEVVNPKSDPEVVQQYSVTPPENHSQAEAIQKPTVQRQAAHEDSGKGEDKMDVEPPEESVKNSPAPSPPLVDDDPPQDSAPAPEHDDDDDDDDRPSTSEPENADEDENEVEDSASVVPNDENDEEEDIASSRPSSPGGTDVDEADHPPHPVIKQANTFLIPPAPSPVPEQPELDVSPEHSETDEPDPDQDQDQDPDQDPDPEADVEQEEDAADVGQEETGVDNEEVPATAAKDPEVDIEESAAHSSRSPTPEPDLLEMPAHRAEALDALALIELKFALLRERLYVEKMEELVEEEGMILNGTHPELRHLQMELASRRNKRLELAMRRREYEEASIRARKYNEVNSVWEWWAHQRDELQKDVISSHNRKRRKIERQRRAYEKTQPHRLLPRPPLPHSLPPPPPLSTILDFESRAPYSIAYGQRPHRPTLSVLSSSEVEVDLNHISGGKRRFWSVDGPGGPTDSAPGYVNGINGNGDMKFQRPPAMAYDVTSMQHFRSVAMAPYPNEEMGTNGWGKRPDEPGRGERERERDRSSQRQMAPIMHNHTIPPQPIPHTHPPHTHPLHAFPHPHQHTHTAHIHPPHHHHVHVHHHHHNGSLASPPPGTALPPPSGSTRRFQDASLPQHGHLPSSSHPPPDEKVGNGGYWRREDGEVMPTQAGGGHERDRDRVERDRDRDRERERDRRGSGIDSHGPPVSHSSTMSMGYERVLPSPFASNSPRRKDSWDEGMIRPPIGSPGSRMATSHPHPLHPRNSNALGSPGTPPLPPPPHSGIPSGPSMNIFPSSPRPVSITPIPAGHAPVSLSKPSNSRPLSPVPAKMVGGNSGAYLSNMTDNSRGGGLRGEPGGGFGGSSGPGGRNDVYGESGDAARHDARVTAAINLTGVGGGSTAEYPLRERRERLF